MTEFANAAFTSSNSASQTDALTDYLHEHLQEGDVVISIFSYDELQLCIR